MGQGDLFSARAHGSDFVVELAQQGLRTIAQLSGEGRVVGLVDFADRALMLEVFEGAEGGARK